MKVLIVSVFPPDPAPEANHALHISEHLATSGLEVHVLCRKGSIPATGPGITVHPVIEDWTWSDLPKLVKCLRQCRPDVVLLLYIGWVYHHEPMITFLPTICRSVLPGVPCVTQFEQIDDRCPPRSFLTRALRKAMALWAGMNDVHRLFGTLLRDSTSIIVLSSPHRDRLAKHDPTVSEKVVILPPPPLIRVCADEPAVARKRTRDALGVAENDFVLAYWGYIYPGKGLETLFEAFRIVCRRHGNMRLLLVGGNLEFPKGGMSCRDYFDMVQQLPDRLAIADRVTWTGPFRWDSDSGSRYLHAADACVLPMDYGVTLNNSSLAAAGIHGLPVISTTLPVGRDEALEHGRNIYLCRPQDPEMLAEAIHLVRDAPDFRERLRSGILHLAREWHGWDAMTERLIGVLRGAVSTDGTPGRQLSSSPRAAGSGRIQEPAEEHRDRRHQTLPDLQRNDSHLPSSMRPAQEMDEPLSGPLVSVIVAVYNVDKYLSQCLDSLVNQTLRNIEIIAVNDASTDNSAGILKDYQRRYPNLRVIHCDSNGGLGSVRNIGLSAAKGQYVAFTDGDDWADITMCEALYRRAVQDDADVLIADAHVFYEDSKTFAPLFDQAIRQTLHPRLRTMPFRLSGEPRVLLLEPVAWTKLYKRSFLRKERIHFEDGMSSYEDICFHFSVLCRASRISLTDDALSFYRQNRPGQISGMTHRKLFEVFAVFRRIQDDLVAWDASTEIWTMLIKIQLRQFDWLLRDRVQPAHRREFFALAARQFERIPEVAFRDFAQANPDDSPRVMCMRRNWLRAYEALSDRRWPLFPLVSVLLHHRPRRVLKHGFTRRLKILRHRLASRVRSFLMRCIDLTWFEEQLQTLQHDLNRLRRRWELAANGPAPVVGIRRINGQMLFFSRCPHGSGLSEAVRRVKADYYLSQTAVFREGDTVVDIGAHVGVFSIYLAKKYPFIKVFAVEPDPTNFSHLRRNVELNGVKNVTAINKALSGDGQRRTLYVDPRSRTWATLDARMAYSRRVVQAVEVDTVTLSDLFQQYGIRHCRLLKITAPGALGESLKGFPGTPCVDLLCGEADLRDCPLPQLEVASWRIARQHFWRTRAAGPPDGTVDSWVQQPPTRMEQLAAENSPSVI